MYHWNVHRIRATKNQNAPNGKPLLMYTMPQLFGGIDHLCLVDSDKLRVIEETCNIRGQKCDETILGLCNLLLNECGIQKSHLLDDLVQLYIFLRTKIRNMLHLQ